MPLLEAGAPTTAMVLLQWKGTHTGFDRNRIDTQSPSKTGGNQGRLPTGLLGQGGGHIGVDQGSMKGNPLDSSVAETTGGGGGGSCTSLTEESGQGRLGSWGCGHRPPPETISTPHPTLLKYPGGVAMRELDEQRPAGALECCVASRKECFPSLERRVQGQNGGGEAVITRDAQLRTGEGSSLGQPMWLCWHKSWLGN